MRNIFVAIGCLALTSPALAQQAPAASASAVPSSAGAPPAAPAPRALNIRSTSDLVALCNTPDTDPSYPNAIGLCVGYGSGVLDYHRLDTVGHKRARKVCLPAQTPTRGEARRMFVAWAQSHPEYMDEPAVDGVMRFLMTTFPCGK